MNILTNDMIWMPSHSRLIMTGLSVCSEMTSRKHPYFLMSSLLHSGWESHSRRLGGFFCSISSQENNKWCSACSLRLYNPRCHAQRMVSLVVATYSHLIEHNHDDPTWTWTCYMLPKSRQYFTYNSYTEDFRLWKFDI